MWTIWCLDEYIILLYFTSLNSSLSIQCEVVPIFSSVAGLKPDCHLAIITGYFCRRNNELYCDASLCPKDIQLGNINNLGSCARIGPWETTQQVWGLDGTMVQITELDSILTSNATCVQFALSPCEHPHPNDVWIGNINGHFKLPAMSR